MEYKCLDVSKIYHKFASRKEFVGIEDVNLTLNSGEIIGVIGLSSSGKSTLIELLSGRVKPSKGKLTYNGKEIARVYNENSIKLNKNLSVYDNMVLFGKKEGMSELNVENRMAQLRDIFSLNKYINTKASELDELNRVKCEIAITLLITPRMLFIDDAFVYLNNVVKNEILKSLKILNKQERTIIVIAASNFSEIEKISKRIIVTDKSRIIYDNTIEDFKNRYCSKKMIEVYLNKNVNINKLEGLEVLESSDYYFKLLFDNKNNMLSEVIKLFDINTIMDLKIGYQDLMDIIEMIKKGEEK